MSHTMKIHRLRILNLKFHSNGADANAIIALSLRASIRFFFFCHVANNYEPLKLADIFRNVGTHRVVTE